MESNTLKRSRLYYIACYKILSLKIKYEYILFVKNNVLGIYHINVYLRRLSYIKKI